MSDNDFVTSRPDMKGIDSFRLERFMGRWQIIVNDTVVFEGTDELAVCKAFREHGPRIRFGVTPHPRAGDDANDARPSKLPPPSVKGAPVTLESAGTLSITGPPPTITPSAPVFEVRHGSVDTTRDGTTGLPRSFHRESVQGPASYFIDDVEVSFDEFKRRVREAGGYILDPSEP